MSNANLTLAQEDATNKRGRLSNKQFIELWQAAENIDDFCEKSAQYKGSPMRKQSAYARSRHLRDEKGIPLKKFTRSANTDWDELRSYAASLISSEELEAAETEMERRRQRRDA